MAVTQPIRTKHQARALTNYYLKRGEPRNYVLVVMALHTALRISDLLLLTWDDVYDFERRHVRRIAAVTEKKTGKTKLITLNARVAAALNVYAHAAKRGAVLIESRKGSGRPISRIQAYRLIRAAAEALGFHYGVSCHSLRKTFGYLAWKSGISPAVIMEIYNHSSFAITRRYLGVTQDDKDECYRKLAELT
jgi:integrase